jgi:hypothetical protein
VKIFVGFSRSKSKLAIGSLLIRLFEKTEYSHVYMRIGPFIVQSNHVGTHIIDKYTFEDKNDIIKENVFELIKIFYILIFNKDTSISCVTKWYFMVREKTHCEPSHLIKLPQQLLGNYQAV